MYLFISEIYITFRFGLSPRSRHKITDSPESRRGGKLSKAPKDPGWALVLLRGRGSGRCRGEQTPLPMFGRVGIPVVFDLLIKVWEVFTNFEGNVVLFSGVVCFGNLIV